MYLSHQSSVFSADVCGECGHVIASHSHVFAVKDGVQEYSMECMLCGSSEDERSVLPVDPQQFALLREFGATGA
jgi:hypothetical protein